MIRNYHTTITDYIFNKKTFSELKESTFGDKWPVVYIIEDKGKRLAYIGETTNICNRINQHWNNPKRKKLKSIHKWRSTFSPLLSTRGIPKRIQVHLANFKKTQYSYSRY